ncbi:hypothetical protein BESB_026670 [Besnoitia besnoiti]|uniref:Uncharacterized protein n=1 Tax=Besnoitia besnoiti TaxID=94643 RepID=A0A2A9M7P4_BESBE|nr:uncharacterized protein BESB_026670 [Besnoitia besnoiti]PFH31693.1 hypothetical protein BESB_026670 [Besnoitia besnoiti]
MVLTLKTADTEVANARLRGTARARAKVVGSAEMTSGNGAGKYWAIGAGLKKKSGKNDERRNVETVQLRMWGPGATTPCRKVEYHLYREQTGGPRVGPEE